MAKTIGIQVKATNPNMRNQRIAGVGGRTYWIEPHTGLLHQVDGPHPPAVEPGVHPDCAARFRQFNGYEVEKRPPAPPPPPRRKVQDPPSPTDPASGESETGGAPPDSDLSVTGSPDASDEPVELPEDDDELTIKGWLKLADSLGLGLTEDEAATRPKGDLVALIRSIATDTE